LSRLVSLRIDIAWLITTLLMSVRVAAALFLIPVFGPAQIPAPVKVLLALVLGAYLVSTLTGSPHVVNSAGELALATLAEATIGLAFGFGFLVAYAATQVAGRALDVQIGFGAASILNPATQTLAPLIGSVLGMAMIASFLALDGHHALLRALATSAVVAPPNSGGGTNFLLVVEQSGAMFTFGLALAAPVMFMLWLSDVAMAVFARSMPQLNVFVLSFAVKIILVTFGLALSIGITRALFGGLFDSMLHFWDRLVAN
jgi:flagellar biosynthesis protein FliR